MMIRQMMVAVTGWSLQWILCQLTGRCTVANVVKLVCCRLHSESSGFQALLAQKHAPVHVARYFNFLSAQPKFAFVNETWNVEKAARDNSSPVGQVPNYCQLAVDSYYYINVRLLDMLVGVKMSIKNSFCSTCLFSELLHIGPGPQKEFMKIIGTAFIQVRCPYVAEGNSNHQLSSRKAFTGLILSWCKGRCALPIHTARTYGPSLWPLHTGVEKCTHTYGPYVWAICTGAFLTLVVCTYRPYVRSQKMHMKMHLYIGAVNTARIYG